MSKKTPMTRKQLLARIKTNAEKKDAKVNAMGVAFINAFVEHWAG